MTEILLPYDHTIASQEYYWDCGPASTQVVLSSRGMVVDENTLIQQMGTTTNGTDDISWVSRVLNDYVGGGYVNRYMPHDPPTAGERDTLWEDIVGSINAGNGMVANIIAPPSNYPRGVNGSISPAYGGGTIYHYVALMGYKDDNGFRCVWVADTGFSPYGYWISFDQLATLIPDKGYAFSFVPFNVQPTTPAPEPSPAGSTLFGIDVSNHQGNFDFAAAAREGFVFATHKITESDNYRDPFWPRARAEMAQHFPGRWGGYHFYRRDTNIDRQADNLLAHIGDTNIPVQLDFEDTANGGTGVGMFMMIDAIRARGMRVFANYVPQWFWDGYMHRPSLAGSPPLWSSNYGSNGVGYARDLYPGDNGPGWASYGGADVALWQFGEHGLVAGQQIDVNAYRGSMLGLQALFSGIPDLGGAIMSLADDELGKKFPSRSKYRANDDVVDTLAGFMLNVDARLHEEMVEREASRKVGWAVDLVKREAAKGDEGAKATLAQIGGK